MVNLKLTAMGEVNICINFLIFKKFASSNWIKYYGALLKEDYTMLSCKKIKKKKRITYFGKKIDNTISVKIKV